MRMMTSLVLTSLFVGKSASYALPVNRYPRRPCFRLNSLVSTSFVRDCSLRAVSFFHFSKQQKDCTQAIVKPDLRSQGEEYPVHWCTVQKWYISRRDVARVAKQMGYKFFKTRCTRGGRGTPILDLKECVAKQGVLLR